MLLNERMDSVSTKVNLVDIAKEINEKVTNEIATDNNRRVQ